MSSVRIVSGTGFFTIDPTANAVNTPEKANAILSALKTAGINELDTARLYGTHAAKPQGSGEALLGLVNAAKEFIIDTKVMVGSLAKGNIRASLEGSLKDLKVDKVNIIYLHGPDRSTPLETVCQEINELYVEGKFEKFGISNHTAEEVQKIVDICKANNYVLPSVYQGSYSAALRSNENTLFPVLRENNISFYAYSPLAAGVLTGKYAAKLDAEKGSRLHPDSFAGKITADSWHKPEIIAIVDRLTQYSKAHDESVAAVSFRWLAYHSKLDYEKGDAIIIGSKNTEQITSTVEWLNQGKLDQGSLEAVEKLWEDIKEYAPPYHW